MVSEIQSPQSSVHDGMGNIVSSCVIAFRAWDLHATQGKADFYNQSDQNNESPSCLVHLASENNSYWSADVMGTIAFQQLYRYQIVNTDLATPIYKIYPSANQVIIFVGKGIVLESDFSWIDDTFQILDYNSFVIYKLHLGTFDDALGERSGPLGRDTNRLQHLAEIGINCAHVMPPSEFAVGFSWGYNGVLSFSIESAYGRLIDFKKFVDKAHGLGIAVITDSVFNHCGLSNLDDCLRRFDAWTRDESNNGIYSYTEVYRAETTWEPWSVSGRQEVNQIIRDHVLFLLNEYHCDGLRVDSTINIWGFNDGQGWNHDGFGILRCLSDEKNFFHRYPRHKIGIAENLHNDGWLVTKLTNQNSAEINAEWHWFIHSIRHALETLYDHFRNINEVAQALYARCNRGDLKCVSYTECHVQSGNKDALARRIYSKKRKSWFAQKRTMLGAVLTLTASGIPRLWQDKYTLSSDKLNDTRPLDRERKKNFGGVFSLYHDLCRLHLNWYNHIRDLRDQHINFHVINNFSKVFAFHRWNEGGFGEDAMIILNFSARTWNSYHIELPRWGT